MKKTVWGLPAVIACVAGGTFLLGACGTYSMQQAAQNRQTQQWTGVIIQMYPLCLGRHAATGDCFGASPKSLMSFTPGDCVQITFVPIQSETKLSQLTAIRHVPASSDPNDCPASP
jgi:hypothetical protein